MDTCEVAIVGGGPAGSACAWRLRQSGVDVVVVDKATFPRDKVCAGWITPQVLDDLRIDPADYRERRILQPITGFRVGVIGSDHTVETSYHRAVSFGIRRCEFDDYLLQRSGARLLLGTPISSIRRADGRWVLNDRVSAAMLIGAGGHFCPVARLLNGPSKPAPLVVAQEAEFAVDARNASAFRINAEQPELYFCADLTGYGWCLRKGDYLNVGFGCIDRHAVPRATAEFVTFLTARKRIPATVSCLWRGHAYVLSGCLRRRAVDESVMLIGDAAGLAYPQSGEGIRPAIESGLMAASTVVRANGRYARDRLESYERWLQERFGVHSIASLLSSAVHAMTPTALATRLLGTPWFVRHVVLDRWFLRAQEPPFGPTAIDRLSDRSHSGEASTVPGVQAAYEPPAPADAVVSGSNGSPAVAADMRALEDKRYVARQAEITAGRLLARNEGVIASNGPIHGRVVDAIRQLHNRAQPECERAEARPHLETESPWAGTKPST